MRIGHGYDVHRLVDGRRLILGGVEIPFEKGLDGHSDADVLVHAVIDAVMGAAKLGDIGKAFPDSDMSFKDISSILLLKKTAEALANKGYTTVNVDCVVVMQAPKIGKFTEKMCENIASALGILPECVSIKGKTEEGLGFVGNGEGVKAIASVLIEKI